MAVLWVFFYWEDSLDRKVLVVPTAAVRVGSTMEAMVERSLDVEKKNDVLSRAISRRALVFVFHSSAVCVESKRHMML